MDILSEQQTQYVHFNGESVVKSKKNMLIVVLFIHTTNKND